MLSGHDWRVAGFVPGDAEFQQVATNPELTPAHGWVTAVVPGHVQSDLVDAGVLPDPFVDLQSLACEWTSDRDWVYEKTFAATPGPARLCFGGVDHDCEVYLNGSRLGAHSGMFRFSFEVELAAENVLRVLVRRAPESEDELGDTSKVRWWKARFPYWWDFSARLVPVGIWEDVWLEPAQGLGDVAVFVGEGTVDVRARPEALVTVIDPDGAVVATGGPGVIQVDEARLWWPNGHGEQPLYTVRVSYGDEVDERRVGFRSIELDDFRWTVNGRDIEILGWNWVPVHQLYGRRHEDAYRNLVRRARDAGATMIRVWGGGLLERSVFYDLCDEAGILVWQDFLQSSSAQNCEPSTDPAYLEHAVEQAGEMVRARRHHASLAVWCAGNELAVGKDRIPLTDEHPNAVALRAVAAAKDPGRAWLVTTPTGEVPFAHPDRPGLNVHGNYWHAGYTEQQAFYDNITCRFQGEVGVDGAANIDTLRRTISRPWPPSEQWTHKGAWWQKREAFEAAFGVIDDLETFVAAHQWFQAQGLRVVVEAARRRWPEQTGILLWQLNEPWPNSACTSVVDVYGYAKPGYWAVADAFRAVPHNGPTRWYDALTGVSLDGPVEGGIAVRVDGGRQEIVSSVADQPLRRLLDVKASLDVEVRGQEVHISAAGGPLHGVFLQTTVDHGGPYLDSGWRWFINTGETWVVTAEGRGELVVSALNSKAVRVTVG